MQNQTPQNTLSLLLNAKIITNDMMEAGYLYGEICHARPAGGPLCARANPFHQKESKSSEKNLELLWHDLHKILKRSPLKKIIESLTNDNDMEVFTWVLDNRSTHPFIRDALSNLASCLKSYGYLE